MSNSGELIKKVRLNRGFTIRTIADTIPISCERLSEIERGNAKLNVINMLRLAEILFVDNESILYDAFAKDNNTLPIDVLQYILDNNLSDAIRIFMEKDASGDLLIDLAMQLKDRKIK